MEVFVPLLVFAIAALAMSRSTDSKH